MAERILNVMPMLKIVEMNTDVDVNHPEQGDSVQAKVKVGTGGEASCMIKETL